MSLFLGAALALATGRQTPQLPPTPAQLEMEVLENVRNQPLGDGTVADLGLPEDFLRRVADRIVRSSFEDRYRIVVQQAEAPTPGLLAGSSLWTILIALFAAAVALLAVVWTSIARRKGLGGT